MLKKDIIQIQVALFFKNQFLGDFENISLKLKNVLGKSKNSQIFPIPNNAPADIPRLMLTYDDFSINVSQNRLDVFCKSYVCIKDKIPLIANVSIVDFQLVICRIGFIKNYFVDGALEDLKKIIQIEKIKSFEPAEQNIKEINIRINFKKIFDVYECNNIQSMEMGAITTGKVNKNGIIVVRDVNTVSEKISEYQFTQNKISELFDSFDKESDSIFE